MGVHADVSRIGRHRPRGVIGLALVAGALLAGCGGPRNGVTLEACLAEHTDAAAPSLLPPCVWTTVGAMPTERDYVAGVVDCELGGVRDAPAALEAQAIAARTYLARRLERRGNDSQLPLTSRFQCWRSDIRPHARAAALATRDRVMHVDGALINANYVAGAGRLREDCTPRSPAANGYGDTTWEAMRRAYLDARRARRRRPFDGVWWTEVVVTRNEDREGEAVEGTPMASPHPTNRGAMGQNAAVCLARRGYDTEDILRYFYGADVELYVPLHPPLDPLVLPPEALEPEPPPPPDLSDGDDAAPPAG